VDDEDNIVWGTSCANERCSAVVWGPSTEDNIVWGTIKGQGTRDKGQGTRQRVP
jgi:hypothetical protein